MAITKSTTQQSQSVTPKHIRHLQVGYLASSARKRPPHIRIVGRWVEQAGFPVGTHVNVEVSDGRIVIERAPPSEHAPPLKRVTLVEKMAMLDQLRSHE